ncbi:Aconitate hydratase precursor [compost metagenome]
MPLQFKPGEDATSLGLNGTESFDILGVESGVQPTQDVTLRIHRKDGSQQDVTLLARIDTAIEATYFANGGILPYVLSSLLEPSSNDQERESCAINA